MKHTAKETKVRRPMAHIYMYTETSCTSSDRAGYPRFYSYGQFA